MNPHPQENRALRVPMLHLFRMRLFAKMKMRRNRVLEKMNQKESSQDVNQSALAAQVNRFRNHLQKRHRKHVPRAQREKILQIPPRPLPVNHKVPAQQIPARGDKAEHSGKRDAKWQIVIHEESSVIRSYRALLTS